jgi:hypothetical protein
VWTWGTAGGGSGAPAERVRDSSGVELTRGSAASRAGEGQSMASRPLGPIHVIGPVKPGWWTVLVLAVCCG